MKHLQRVLELQAELEKAARSPTVQFAGFGDVLRKLGEHVKAEADLVLDLQRRVAELERNR